MNIVYVHQHFSTARGHTGTRSYDFARYLVARGHRVTVVTGVYGASDLAEMALERRVTHRTIDGIDLCIINIRHDNKQAFWRRIASFLAFMAVSTIEVLKIRDADVVFATSTPLTTGLPGTLARWLRGVPFVFEVRDIWPESVVQAGGLRNPLLRIPAYWAERIFYRAATRIVAVSRRMADWIRGTLGPRGDKVSAIYLGTDIPLFSQAQPDLGWRRSHGLEGKFVAVYAGAHGRVNALGWVLKAAAILKADPRLRIVMIGDGLLKAALMVQARAEGLDNVVWLDPVPKEKLPGILKACDLGLMTLENVPLFNTVCPNKFMDYLASGLPVLVNFGGEVADFCREESCGVVVPPEDPKGMAQAIAELAADPARSREMGRRGQALAVRQFDRRLLVEQLESVLAAAVAERRAGG